MDDVVRAKEREGVYQRECASRGAINGTDEIMIRRCGAVEARNFIDIRGM